MDTMPSDLEKSLDSIIAIYHKYSLTKGNYHAVYRDDLKKMLTNELPHYLKVRKGWVWWGGLCLCLTLRMPPGLTDLPRCPL